MSRFTHFASTPEYTGILIFTLLIFYDPAAKRARHTASRHHPGFAGVSASFACAPGAERASTFTAQFITG
jgi:hypothetical protein